MEVFGRAKRPFLRQFLRLKHGIPSHDTFSRVFRQLDPKPFQACFVRFMERFAQGLGGVIAVDGKSLRGSFDRASGKSPLHMVHAWAVDQRLCLARPLFRGAGHEPIFGVQRRPICRGKHAMLGCCLENSNRRRSLLQVPNPSGCRQEAIKPAHVASPCGLAMR
jgi:hypothetical protein